MFLAGELMSEDKRQYARHLLVNPIVVRMRMHPAHAVDSNAPSKALEAVATLVVFAGAELIVAKVYIADIGVLVVRTRANRVGDYTKGGCVHRISAACGARPFLLPSRLARCAWRDCERALQPEALRMVEVLL